ncbi:MAG TPA: hypothetical protein VG013_43115 [Gemmataceae bacterium]|nr:hypothetical protein [Gemmataceae bacterium]
MKRFAWMARWTVVVLLAGDTPALACILCQGGGQVPTLRESAERAKLVLYGTLANPQLDAANDSGTVDLKIRTVLKPDPFIKGKRVVQLQHYVPVDAKDPPKFLAFCDVYQDKDKRDQLDAYWGVQVKSAAVAAYLQGILALDPKDRTRALLYFFKYLDDGDPLISNDAYVEFAKANDKEIGQVAGKLSASKLRGWLQSDKTPANRLSLYAFLLGACGTDKDADLLRGLIRKPNERMAGAIDGLLGGYIRLRPREGWDVVVSILQDENKPFPERFNVLRTVRFYHGWKPDDTRREVLRAVAGTLGEGDFADMTIDDLRRWELWDLTGDVLAQFGKKSHAAPIMRRTIVRYALCCPKPEAARFVADVRRREPDLVKDVEEELQFEKK